MKNYYLIPIKDNTIYINNKNLRSILEETYPELIQMEEERINILYSVSPLRPLTQKIKNEYNKHLEKTKKMYEALQIPQFLIIYGNESYAEEIVTKLKISFEYPSALAIRRKSKEEAENYFFNSNYINKINKYSNNLQNLFETYFQDDYEFEGYIEGKLDEQEIKGIFKGRIRKK